MNLHVFLLAISLYQFIDEGRNSFVIYQDSVYDIPFCLWFDDLPGIVKYMREHCNQQ